MSSSSIEEAAANLTDPNICKTDNWIEGAKWMQKRMYSEQTVFLILSSLRHDMIYGTVSDLRKWFKDFKK
jgi:hypothetical protein